MVDPFDHPNPPSSPQDHKKSDPKPNGQPAPSPSKKQGGTITGWGSDGNATNGPRF